MNDTPATLGGIAGTGHLVVDASSAIRELRGTFEPDDGRLGPLKRFEGKSVTFEGVIYAASEPRHGSCQVQVAPIDGSTATLTSSGAPTFKDDPPRGDTRGDKTR